MKFASWNLFIKSKKQIEAIKFLLGLDIDFICLQELREDTAQYLDKLNGYHANYCDSFSINVQKVFSGIVSKNKPIETRRLKFKNAIPPTALAKLAGISYERSECVFNDYSISPVRSSREELNHTFAQSLSQGIHPHSKTTHSASNGVNGKTIRLFNVHLPYGSSPLVRLSLITEVYGNLRPEHINIVCGDFNSFGHFPWNITVGPFNGSKRKDYQTNELKELREISEHCGLKLSINEAITYPLCRTHIDHIIIPKTWHSYRCDILEKRLGSDHRIVVLEENEITRV